MHDWLGSAFFQRAKSAGLRFCVFTSTRAPASCCSGSARTACRSRGKYHVVVHPVLDNVSVPLVEQALYQVDHLPYMVGGLADDGGGGLC